METTDNEVFLRVPEGAAQEINVIVKRVLSMATLPMDAISLQS